MSGDDLVEACPDCDSTNISNIISGGMHCSACGASFEEPVRREAQSPGPRGPALKFIDDLGL